VTPTLLAACELVVDTHGLSGGNKAGAPVDAGANAASDADPGAAPAESGACGCAPGSVLCEDFEGPAPSAVWQLIRAPTHDVTRAHCGQASLHVHTPGFNAGDDPLVGLQTSLLLGDARLAGGVFARAWVYLPSTSPLPGNNFFGLIEVRQTAAPFFGVALQINASSSSVTNWTTNPDTVTRTSTALPRDAWTCVEWQVSYGATDGSSRFWIGGASEPAIAQGPIMTAPTPPYRTFVLGAYFGGNATQPAFDLWLDDVVLDATLIGCGP
jgi:hypothetical protein